MIPEDSQLVRDSAIKSAATVRQAGRPRKGRVRPHGEKGGKGRKAYKCANAAKSATIRLYAVLQGWWCYDMPTENVRSQELIPSD